MTNGNGHIPQLTEPGDPPSSTQKVEASTVDAVRFATTMTKLMEDVIAGKVTPQVANAACNAGSQLLKLLQLHYRYGPPPEDGQP